MPELTDEPAALDGLVEPFVGESGQHGADPVVDRRSDATGDLATGPRAEPVTRLVDVDIDVGAGGTFATQLYTGRLDLTFSPFISWNTFVQYDTESEDISTQTRLRWILEPGRELFVVGLFGFFRDGSGQTFQSGEQGVTVKLNYTLRF